jgi:hypothetical protein
MDCNMQIHLSLKTRTCAWAKVAQASSNILSWSMQLLNTKFFGVVLEFDSDVNL